jgi:hypothetical protein
LRLIEIDQGKNLMRFVWVNMPKTSKIISKRKDRHNLPAIWLKIKADQVKFEAGD